MSLPPRWVRRLVIWPLPLLLVWLYVASVPLLLIVAAVVSYRLPGSLRAVRALGLATVYAFVEVAVIVAAFGLWIATGFGARMQTEWSQRRHHQLLAWAVRTIVAAGRRLFRLEIEVSGSVQTSSGRHPIEPPGPMARPLVVMSRHAGPADSILLVHELVTRFGRRPRVVLNEALQWDPVFDILLNRLPSHFVRHGADRAEVLDELRSLAGSMTEHDAFVIFPEGGNFTEGRRERAIAYFEEHGRTAEAERARRLVTVLPPRTNGALAALDGCPSAAPVFVAHTGLDDITGLRDLWRSIPDHKTLDVVFVAIQPDQVPDAEADRVELMWVAWEQIDAWIRAAGATSDDGG